MNKKFPTKMMGYSYKVVFLLLLLPFTCLGSAIRHEYDDEKIVKSPIRGKKTGKQDAGHQRSTMQEDQNSMISWPSFWTHIHQADKRQTEEEYTYTPPPAFTPCDDDEVTVELYLQTDYYGHETDWHITDVVTGEQVASAGLLNNNTAYEHRYCFPSANSCMEFKIKDSYGDGFSQPGGYNLTVDGVIVATSHGIGENFRSSEKVYFPEGCEECASDEVEVELYLQTDNFGDETSWNITDVVTGEEVAGAHSLSSYTTYEHRYCFPSASCMMFEIKDSYGDGIALPDGYNFTVDGILFASSGLNDYYDDGGYDDGGYDDNFGSSYKSKRFGGGCDATETPTTSPTFSPCADDEMTVKLDLQEDAHGTETDWDIVDLSTGDKFAGESNFFETGALHEYQYCIPSDMCLRFEMKDSWGDGISKPFGYNFTVDDVLLATSFDDYGGNFGYSEESTFGDGCTCEDDKSWRYEGKSKKNCGWVYFNPSKHCSKVSAEGVPASEACPIACGDLRTKSCDIPKCSDDSWFYWWPKRGGKWKGCNAYLHQHVKSRCSNLGISASGFDFAYEYCSECSGRGGLHGNACVP